MYVLTPYTLACEEATGPYAFSRYSLPKGTLLLANSYDSSDVHSDAHTAVAACGAFPSAAPQLRCVCVFVCVCIRSSECVVRVLADFARVSSLLN